MVLFTWAQFLKEDALRFLHIHTLLELPSVEHSTQDPLHDLSSAAVAQADQSGQEDFLHEGSVSCPLDQSVQGAASLPIHPREPSPNGDQTLSGLSLTPSQALLSQLLIYDADQQQKQFATTVFDCGVCFMSCLGSDCVQLSDCGHIFCQVCLGQFCKLQITEGNVRGVTCPQADCTATPTPAQVQSWPALSSNCTCLLEVSLVLWGILMLGNERALSFFSLELCWKKYFNLTLSVSALFAAVFLCLAGEESGGGGAVQPLWSSPATEYSGLYGWCVSLSVCSCKTEDVY